MFYAYAPPAIRAGQLVYQPINPVFGGSPLNGSYLLGEANAQNIYNKTTAASSSSSTSSSSASLSNQFIQQLQGTLLSGLANQVSQAIFPASGVTGPQSGQIIFGNQTISFARGLENITLTIANTSTGSSTTIQVPTLQTNLTAH